MAKNTQEQAITTKYLIIGNSAGGIGAAEAIRLMDKTGSVTMLSDEPYPAYSRPMISEYLARHATLERMLYRPADFYARNRITTIFGKKATKLDPDGHTVELDSGESIAWEKVLVATGGTPIVSQVEGATKDNIFTFTTLDDAKAIDRFISGQADSPIHAVVVGGGLIGFSVTEALVNRGVTVTIVEMKDRVLNTIIDEDTSAIAEEALQKASVEVVCNHTVARAATDAKGSITGVTLDDGRAIACRMLIMAIGVRPRLDLVAGTGIKTNRGIVVDRHMMTSHDDIYACGDVAEAYDFVYGSNRLSPIWPNAYVGGRAAGSNMAGRSVEYAGGTAMNSLKYFGLAIASAGASVPPDSSYEVLGTKADHSIRKIVVKDNVVAGMVLCGDVDKSGIVLGLMRDRVDISDFKKALMSPDFGLASLPETLWRERLGVVPAGFHAEAMKEKAEEEPGVE
jgi:NAD(P)H-nitrite reductase large subunit